MKILQSLRSFRMTKELYCHFERREKSSLLVDLFSEFSEDSSAELVEVSEGLIIEGLERVLTEKRLKYLIDKNRVYLKYNPFIWYVG